MEELTQKMKTDQKNEQSTQKTVEPTHKVEPRRTGATRAKSDEVALSCAARCQLRNSSHFRPSCGPF
ncbi:hypothetical protein Csa_009528 [Cucumis sativus]|uniref:Uncharacterized protein n=1 Tax=Cucumis sativus TaxID=3659 RepID=A0A0A0L6Z0_CUCSA|nr:hypothetical protein Csa_009528 [Cucumis sativus]